MCRYVLELLRGPATGHAQLAKACAACLRQLAGSDPNKPKVVDDNGFATLVHTMRVFGERAGDKACGEADKKLYQGGAVRGAFRLSVSLETARFQPLRLYTKSEKPGYKSLLSNWANPWPLHRGVQEQCIGTLVALCLRFPEAGAVPVELS